MKIPKVDTYLLGARIRAARRDRGLSQAELAEKSAVSLRFVGQIESGKANVSIGRLAEIAAGLEVSLVTLLAGLGSVRDTVDRLATQVREMSATDARSVLDGLQGLPITKISLIGLRGAGKSTIGRIAAEALGWRFEVVDDRVRAKVGLSMADLFEIHGVAGYHRVSREVLAACLDDPDPAVLEVGGSVVTDPDAWRLLEARSRVVWLQATAEDHLARVIAQGDTRPMAGHDDALARLREILAEREPYYRRAHLTIDTSRLDIPTAARAVTKVETVREAKGRGSSEARTRRPSLGRSN